MKIEYNVRPSDEIGRRARLKIWCWQQRAGSTPALGKFNKTLSKDRVFLLKNRHVVNCVESRPINFCDICLQLYFY